MRYIPTVWRIAKNSIPAPIFSEPVLLFGVEFNTLSIMRGGARIKCKMKFTIEFIIEILWCGPQIGLR